MKFNKTVDKSGKDNISFKIENNYSIHSICIDLFGYSNGRTTKFIKEYISHYKIDISHFDRSYKNRRYEKILRNCLNCNEEFETTTKEDKKTCSHKCSNVYFSHKRKVYGTKIIPCKSCEKEVEVNKHTTTVTCEECVIQNKDECKECGKHLSTKNKTGYCAFCVSKSDEYKKKMSKVMQKCVKEGKHHGWSARYKLKPSYPEKYFIGLLDNEGISFEREVKIGKYFVDFLLPKNIVLEVDGRQHKTDPNRIKSDIHKDNFLIKEGYSVYRID